MANRKNTKTKNWETIATSPLEVTNVDINWTNDSRKSNLKALGVVTLNNAININISLIESKDGELFVSLPQTKKDNKYFNLVFISDTSVMEDITKTCIDEYNAM